MQTIELRKYIGKPYEKYNCFDLVKEFYLDHYNLSLSNYWEGKEVPSRSEVEGLIVSNKGDFLKVDKPQFGDIVVIALYGLECHIGVVVDKGMFIHSTRNIGSNMEPLKKYQRMIAGYFRHRDLND